jgi:hypothetical protein
MLRVPIGALCALALLAAAALAQDKPSSKIKPDAVPGYKIRSVEGFTVIVSDETLKQDGASRLERKPLDVLALELKTLSGLMPPKILTALHGVLIWVEWDEEVPSGNGRPGTAVATYFGGHQAAMLAKGMHPLKAKNVTVQRMKSLALEHQPKKDSGRCVLLHEIAHAVHDQVLSNDNVAIKAAYKQAMERQLLDKQAYAATNEREFFAEMTCAYFNQLHYYPRTHDDLKKSDPATFKLLETLWGKSKAGTTARAPRAGGDSELTLEKVPFGKPAAGPKVTAADLQGRVALVVLWNAGSTSSLNFLTRATAWDAELSEFGLTTVGVHMTGNKPQDVAAAARAHALAFAVTESVWADHKLITDSKEFPVALVFDRDGSCVYRGSAFDAEEALRAAVGEALVARGGAESPPKGLAPVVEALQKGKSPSSVMPRLATLTRSPDADTAAAARVLLTTLTEGGRKAIDEAEALARDDPVAAFLRVERVPTVYRETAVAAKANDLITRLKTDRAVATELRARTGLATVKKLDTELRGRPGSFDPSSEKFRKDNALLLRQLEDGVAQMKKSWPKARATEDACHIAEKYGLAGR